MALGGLSWLANLAAWRPRRPPGGLAVEDRGPGIPPEERDRVFQRHARLNQHSSSSQGGLGLGLYITRQLAHANHGQLWVVDAPRGRGVRLELRVPLVTSGELSTDPIIVGIATGTAPPSTTNVVADGHEVSDVEVSRSLPVLPPPWAVRFKPK